MSDQNFRNVHPRFLEGVDNNSQIKTQIHDKLHYRRADLSLFLHQLYRPFNRQMYLMFHYSIIKIDLIISVSEFWNLMEKLS